MRPTTWPRIAATLAARLVDHPLADDAAYLSVGIDAPDAAEPGELAAAIAAELRPLGHPALIIPTRGFLRSASIRFEYGKRDPDAYLDLWTDDAAMFREVFDPLREDGTGKVLPDLLDPVTNRATRSPYVTLEPGTIVIVHGPALLKHWFPFDLSVHVQLSDAAFLRRTPEAEHWKLAAFRRYREEYAPHDSADVIIRADDPKRPAWTA